MRVLIACEYTGVVREAFHKLGHIAFSCDIKDSLIPSNYHIKGNVLEYLDWDWDLLIAHPPCTHLATSGARWFKDKKEVQQEAIEFFMKLAKCKIPKKAIENPKSIMSTVWRKPDQIIHPWMFGDPYSKGTCLWLENLPKLEPTNIVEKGEFVIHGGKKIAKWYSNSKKERDKTFPGIANAMAEQWGE